MCIIILSNTYFQLLTAIQIRMKFFKNDDVDIIITDISSNSKEVYDNLTLSNAFRNVFYNDALTVNKAKKQLKDKMADILNITFGEKKPTRINGYYDELLYCNSDINVHILYATLAKRNKSLICSKYEEGILSYNTNFTRYLKINIAYWIRMALKKTNLDLKTRKFYCYLPQAYNGLLTPIQIPSLSKSDSDLLHICEIVFQISREVEELPKYIFLASYFDNDEDPIGELEVIMRIVKAVGANNIIIKKHPRDKTDRFLQYGFRVMANIHIPWEVYQLFLTMSNKTLISAFSNAVISMNLVVSDPIHTLLVYKLCNVDYIPQVVEACNRINTLIHNKKLNTDFLTIINSLDEVVEYDTREGYECRML